MRGRWGWGSGRCWLLGEEGFDGFEDDGVGGVEEGALVKEGFGDLVVGEVEVVVAFEEKAGVADGAVDELEVVGGDVGHEVVLVAAKAAHDQGGVGVEEEFEEEVAAEFVHPGGEGEVVGVVAEGPSEGVVV